MTEQTQILVSMFGLLWVTMIGIGGFMFKFMLDIKGEIGDIKAELAEIKAEIRSIHGEILFGSPHALAVGGKKASAVELWNHARHRPGTRA